MRAERLAAVTFDFWETLVRDTPDNLRQGHELRLTGVGAVLERVGLPAPAAVLADAYGRSGAQMRERYWAVDRDATIREQVRLFLEAIDPGLTDRLGASAFEAAVDAYISPVLALPPELVPGAHEAVRRLAERGLRLGIVSNTGRTPGIALRRVLERHGLLRYFDAISYSDEVGTRKPAADIFARTLEALGARPRQALHVGDNPRDDVLGARSLGMRAAHYASDGRSPSPEADVVLRHLAELEWVLAAP